MQEGAILTGKPPLFDCPMRYERKLPERFCSDGGTSIRRTAWGKYINTTAKGKKKGQKEVFWEWSQSPLFDPFSFCFVFETESCYVVHASLKLFHLLASASNKLGS